MAASVTVQNTPEPRQLLGWRIYYADGSVVNGTTRLHWMTAPSDGLTAVQCFYAEQYKRFDAGTWRIENYVLPLRGRDYFWLDEHDHPWLGNLAYERSEESKQAGIEPVPATGDSIKTGQWLLDTDWNDLQNFMGHDLTWDSQPTSWRDG